MFNEHYIKRCSNFKYVHLYAFFLFIQAKLSASPFVQICNALYTVQQNKTKPRRINSIIVVNYLERHLSVIFLCPPCAYLNVRRCLNTCPYRMFKIFIFRFLHPLHGEMRCLAPILKCWIRRS